MYSFATLAKFPFHFMLNVFMQEWLSQNGFCQAHIVLVIAFLSSVTMVFSIRTGTNSDLATGQRRKKYYYRTLVPMLLAFFLMLFPEHWVQQQANNWIVIPTFAIFYLSQACFSVIHNAVGAELAGESRVRAKVYRLETVFEWFGVCLVVGGPSLLSKLWNYCDQISNPQNIDFCGHCVDQN